MTWIPNSGSGGSGGGSSSSVDTPNLDELIRQATGIQTRRVDAEISNAKEAAQIARGQLEIARGKAAADAWYQKQLVAIQQRETALKEELGRRELDLKTEIQRGTLDLGKTELALKSEIERGQLALDSEIQRGRLGVEQGRLGLDTELGRGKLGLDTELGRGRLALDTELGRGQLQLSQAQAYADLASTPDDYYKLLDMAAGYGGRLPRPDFLNRLATGQTGNLFGAQGGTPTPMGQVDRLMAGAAPGTPRQPFPAEGLLDPQTGRRLSEAEFDALPLDRARAVKAANGLTGVPIGSPGSAGIAGAGGGSFQIGGGVESVTTPGPADLGGPNRAAPDGSYGIGGGVEASPLARPAAPDPFAGSDTTYNPAAEAAYKATQPPDQQITRVPRDAQGNKLYSASDLQYQIGALQKEIDAYQQHLANPTDIQSPVARARLPVLQQLLGQYQAALAQGGGVGLPDRGAALEAAGVGNAFHQQYRQQFSQFKDANRWAPPGSTIEDPNDPRRLAYQSSLQTFLAGQGTPGSAVGGAPGSAPTGGTSMPATGQQPGQRNTDPRQAAIQAIIRASPPSPVPGYAPQDAQALDLIGSIYAKGLHTLAPQAIESMGPTAQRLFLAGGRRLGRDNATDLWAYDQSRWGGGGGIGAA